MEPRTTPDLMRLPIFDVAGRSPWLSPYTFGRLFTLLAPNLTARSATDAAEQTYLLVGGWVTADGKVDFNHAWQVTSATDPSHYRPG